MTIRTPSSPDMNVCRKSEQSRAPDALCALVRLLAQHAAEDTIKRTRAEQSAYPKNLPTDTGALNDV
jgi:hypothetical protein